MGKVSDVISLILNLFAAFVTFGSIIKFFIKKGDANMQVKKSRCFVFFTVDSNLLAAVVCLVMAYFKLRSLLPFGDGCVPEWAVGLKLVGTTAVMLTLVVVFTILAPNTEGGLKTLLEGSSLFMHLLTPIVCMVSFVLFDGGSDLSYIWMLPALIPTFIYAVVYYIMVMVVGEERGGWKDFYGFNRGGKWYITAPVIFAMTAVLAAAMIFFRNIVN